MFTGLIETKGVVTAHHRSKIGHRLFIEAPFHDLMAGESIAVNGICLTLLPHSKPVLAFDLSPETLKLTTLESLNSGDFVNIERAMMATTRFGGHYVSGHVDTTACLLSKTKMEEYTEITVGDFAKSSKPFLLPKGSISLDGISLTINEVANGSIKIMLVPHTLSVTTFSHLKVGQRLNVEYDYLTRIVAHQLESLINTQ